MSIAAKVRTKKEKWPERFCADPRCLWRTDTRDGFRPCPTHPQLVRREDLRDDARHDRLDGLEHERNPTTGLRAEASK